jgi:hypothetical protein
MRPFLALLLLLSLTTPAGAAPRCLTYEEKTLSRWQTICADGTRSTSTWNRTLQRWESTVTSPPSANGGKIRPQMMHTRTAWISGWAVLVLLLTAGFPAAPDPSSEVCAKVREARKRSLRYGDLSLSHSKQRVLAAEQKLLYTRMGHPPRKVESLMADTYRRLEEERRQVDAAKAAYDRLVDDLIGKVETPWPACEPPK